MFPDATTRYTPAGRKFARRLSLSTASILSRIAPAFFSVALSLVVIRLHSAELWGQIVPVLLITNVIVTMCGVGSGDYFATVFAGRVDHRWWSAVVARGILCVVVCASVATVAAVPLATAVPVTAYAVLLLVHRSLEIIVRLNDRFFSLLFAEVVGSAVFFIAAVSGELTYGSVLMWFAATTGIKVLLVAVSVPLPFLRLSRAEAIRSITGGIAFLLPVLVGLIQSRIDMYIVAALLPAPQLARYHVLIGVLSLVHQVALPAVTPFVRHLYRMPRPGVEKVARAFFRLGVGIAALSVPLIYLGLLTGYGFRLSPEELIASFFVLIPIFYYSIKTHAWLGERKAYPVALVHLGMALVTTAAALAMVSHYGVSGALYANAAGQWFAFAVFTLKR